MPILLDALYAIALLFALPFLIYRSWRTGRYRKHLAAKLLGLQPPLPADSPVWFHGVSVGEIHLLRTIIAAFRERFPGVPIVVSSTTDTGLAEARKAFPDLPVIAFPFDFSWAVASSLQAVRPRVIVLAESELWPNFLRIANRKKVPVAVVNGRLSPRSARRVRRFGRLARWLLYGRVARFGMQTAEYADNLRSIGVPAERIAVTENVKYDGALKDRGNAASRQLRADLGLTADDIILVAGSTHSPEEQIALDTYRSLKSSFPLLRLVIVPRSPDRFEEVARLIAEADFPLKRRSRKGESPEDAVVLIDTLGELSAVWGFAGIAFVGGSFDEQRGGQSMIEPAGYGVPSLFGPHVANFRDAAARLVGCGGAVQCQSPLELEGNIRLWLGDGEARRSAGAAARRLVQEQQGATERTLDWIAPLIERLAGRASDGSAPSVSAGE